jgi:hypothetical protein
MPATAVADLVRRYAAAAAAAGTSRRTICHKVATVLSRCRAAVQGGDNTTVIVLDLKGVDGLTATQSGLLPDDLVPVRLTRQPSC